MNIFLLAVLRSSCSELDSESLENSSMMIPNHYIQADVWQNKV
jgi:hypothetical protein